MVTLSVVQDHDVASVRGDASRIKNLMENETRQNVPAVQSLVESRDKWTLAPCRRATTTICRPSGPASAPGAGNLTAHITCLRGLRLPPRRHVLDDFASKTTAFPSPHVGGFSFFANAVRLAQALSPECTARNVEPPSSWTAP